MAIMNWTIDPSCSDDFIQAQLLKCIFILRHRQITTKSKYLDPVANDAKWEVFWGAVSRHTSSIIHNQDDKSYDFLANYSLLYKDGQLNDWTNKFDNFQSKLEVSIGASEWLPLHCCVFNSIVSDEYTKVLSLASINSTAGGKASKTIETPLHMVVAANNPNIIVINNLLKYFHYMTSAETSTGQIPLHYAAMFSTNVEVIDILIQTYPQGLNEKCSEGEVPLFKACRNRSENSLLIIQKLLQASPHSVKYINKKGETPLHVAIAQLNPSSSVLLIDVIQTLLVACPDNANTRDNNGNSLLFLLWDTKGCRDGINSVLELILNLCPAAASTLNEEQQTPLHKLLRGANGHGKDLNTLVPMLLDAYPKALSVKDKYNCYPIHYAVMNDLNITNIEGIVDGNPAALLSMGMQYSFNIPMTPIQLSLRSYKDTTEGGCIRTKSCDKLALVKYLFSRCPQSIHTYSGLLTNTLLYNAVKHCNDSYKDHIVKAVYHMDPSAAMSLNVGPLISLS